MSNKDISTIRTSQGAFTPAGTDYVLLESNGNTRVVTIDEISVLVSGSTTTSGLSDSKRGARVHRNNDASAQTSGPINWYLADYDTDSFWSAGSPTRLTVPAGITKVKLTALVSHSGTGSQNARIYHLNSSDAPLTTVGLPRTQGQAVGNLVSGVISVTPGDYFELDSSTSAVLNTPESTWFEIEVVEQTP